MAKKKQPKSDIDAKFATEECTRSFVVAFQERFPNCKCQILADNTSVSIWAPKKELHEIRLLTEKSCFGRRAISIYTAY